jgi:hypothetical protein
MGDGLPTQRRSVFFLATTVSVLAGCSSGQPTNQCPAACPSAAVKTEFMSGSIRWQAAGVPLETLPLSDLEDMSPAVGACSVGGLKGPVLPNDAIDTIGPNISCTVRSIGLGLYASVIGLQDPRPLAAGQMSMSGQQAGLAIEYMQPQPGGSFTKCDPNVLGATVTLDVTDATGGSAPYPTMVTSPYSRRYQITIDTGPLTDTACGTIAIHATIQLQQTNADYV